MGPLNGLKSVGGWFKRGDTEGSGNETGEFYVDMLEDESVEGSLSSGLSTPYPQSM